MHKLRLVLLTVILSYPGYALADRVQAASLLPSSITPVSSSQDSDFSFSGYIEPSYNYLVRSNQFTSGIHNRVFDLETEGFTLQQAAITLSKIPPQGLGGLLNLILGRDANTLAPAGVNPDYFGIQNLGLTPTQAYLQYAKSSFIFIGGKYNSSMGAENYNPLTDKNFSRSILDGYAQPSTFIGLEGKYLVNDKLRLSADISNGWDTIKYTGRQKTIEANAIYIPNSCLAFSITGITGIQPITDGASSGPTGRRSALDLIGTLKASDKLSLVANYDYGMQTKAALPTGLAASAFWQGLAAYLNYQYNDKWQTSLRGEIFSDREGYRTGVQQTWKEITLTVAYSLLRNFQIRAETRHDFSNVKSFATLNRLAANTNQQSFALEGLYKF